MSSLREKIKGMVSEDENVEEVSRLGLARAPRVSVKLRNGPIESSGVLSGLFRFETANCLAISCMHDSLTSIHCVVRQFGP